MKMYNPNLFDMCNNVQAEIVATWSFKCLNPKYI